MEQSTCYVICFTINAMISEWIMVHFTAYDSQWAQWCNSGVWYVLHHVCVSQWTQLCRYWVWYVLHHTFQNKRSDVSMEYGTFYIIRFTLYNNVRLDHCTFHVIGLRKNAMIQVWIMVHFIHRLVEERNDVSIWYCLGHWLRKNTIL